MQKPEHFPSQLHQLEKRLLSALSQSHQGMPACASAAGLLPDEASRAAIWLEEKGLVSIKRHSAISYGLSCEGGQFLSAGLPELRVVQKAINGAGIGSLDEQEKKIGISWAKRKGWISLQGGAVSPTSQGMEALKSGSLQDSLRQIQQGRVPDKGLLEEFLSRGIATKSESKSLELALTQHGLQAQLQLANQSSDQSGGKGTFEINQLSRQLIMSGQWKNATLRKYNILEDVAGQQVGKRHVISRFRENIRDIFAQLGFEEMEGSIVESSFWNFDALFQPQDHPARELADTFYANLDMELPSDKGLVGRVAKSHQSGWKYAWQAAEAKKAVLRTHTTAVSARHVSCCKGAGPGKYFCVGKVFRKEATDFKHLAEFFQVEGIIVWEKATMSDLLGILSEFYKRIGFDKIRFRPSFFPYTEPSFEIEVYFEDRKAWMELGGAGIFRPEVSLPLCGRYPVLAWGLSLERPLMLLHDIKDIRTFYQNEIGWLRSMPCLGTAKNAGKAAANKPGAEKAAAKKPDDAK